MSQVRQNKPSNTKRHQLPETKRAMAKARLEAALCHDAYTKINLRAPRISKVKQTTRVPHPKGNTLHHWYVCHYTNGDHTLDLVN